MDCKQFQKWIEDTGDRNLSVKERLELETHRKECKACKMIYQFESWLLTAIEEEKTEHLDPWFTEKVLKKIQNPNTISIPLAEDTQYRIVVSFRNVAAILLVVLAFAAGIFMGQLSQRESEVPYEIAYLNDVTLESISAYLEK